MTPANSGGARFVDRHIGPSDADIEYMLGVVGLDSLDELTERAVPQSIRMSETLDLPAASSEPEILDQLRHLGTENSVYTSLIGMGYYGTFTPSVIQRNVLENPGWYTSYTPYQPEISQGRLEAMLNYQTMVSDLTGMDIANASLLDEATAVAEAMTMLRRVSRSKAQAFFVDSECHPQVIEVVQTRARPLEIEVVVGHASDIDADRFYGAVLQYPGSSGVVRDDRELIARLKDAGVMVAVATDLLALTLLTPPGEMGADVAVGSAQRFGVPMMFGGPHAAFMATKDAFKRSLPGRLVGVTKDSENRMALRLALTTREQHIRREKATSNICTAQALLAVMAGMYAVWHGPHGLTEIARRVHELTSDLAARLTAGGQMVVNDTWFDTLTVRVPERADEVVAAAEQILDADDVYFIGRGLDYAVAMEGSLKLKEISYLHSEAMPAGELKHGTLALVTKGTPVIVVLTQQSVYDKTISAVQEVRARGGKILAVAYEDDQQIHKFSDSVLRIPRADDLLGPVAAVVPLQLWAYHVARLRGHDIDQPRNLAKSVTVE